MKERFNKTIGRWSVVLPDGRLKYRYRYVMEQHIGRPLRTDEHVHHINDDPTDDRLENLQLLTASEHQKLHAPRRVARRRAERAEAWGARGEKRCVVCGTDERPHIGLGKCGRCYYRERARERYGREPRKPPTVVTIECAGCGTTFERTLSQGGSYRKFCSRACWKAHVQQERLVAVVEAREEEDVPTGGDAS